jgi:hypothetical protein
MCRLSGRTVFSPLRTSGKSRGTGRAGSANAGSYVEVAVFGRHAVGATLKRCMYAPADGPSSISWTGWSRASGEVRHHSVAETIASSGFHVQQRRGLPLWGPLSGPSGHKERLDEGLQGRNRVSDRAKRLRLCFTCSVTGSNRLRDAAGCQARQSNGTMASTQLIRSQVPKWGEPYWPLVRISTGHGTATPLRQNARWIAEMH